MIHLIDPPARRLRSRILRPDWFVGRDAPEWDVPLPRRRPRWRRFRDLLRGPNAYTNGDAGGCACCPTGPTITCGSCAIPENLTLTDSNQSIAFTYSGGLWGGSYNISLTNVLNPATLDCVTPLTVITADIPVTYVGQCVNLGGGVYQFEVTQSFDYLFAYMGGGNLLWAGTFANFTCSWSCGPTAAVMYYTPAVGFAYYSSTAAWTTCSPFSWSMSVPATTGGGLCGGGVNFPTLVSPAPGTVTVTS
jgi:hypothetical protein